MIAVCPNCKTIFEDKGIVIENSKNVTLSNNSTTCPKCRSRANYLDGTFNFDSKGVATVLSAPQFTIDILKIVKELIENTQNGKISPEEFHNEINKLPPLVRKTLDLIIPKEPSGFWAMIGVLVIVINNFIGHKDEPSLPIDLAETKPPIELVIPEPEDTTIVKDKEQTILPDTTKKEKK